MPGREKYTKEQRVFIYSQKHDFNRPYTSIVWECNVRWPRGPKNQDKPFTVNGIIYLCGQHDHEAIVNRMKINPGALQNQQPHLYLQAAVAAAATNATMIDPRYHPAVTGQAGYDNINGMYGIHKALAANTFGPPIGHVAPSTTASSNIAGQAMDPLLDLPGPFPPINNGSSHANNMAAMNAGVNHAVPTNFNSQSSRPALAQNFDGQTFQQGVSPTPGQARPFYYTPRQVANGQVFSQGGASSPAQIRSAYPTPTQDMNEYQVLPSPNSRTLAQLRAGWEHSQSLQTVTTGQDQNLMQHNSLPPGITASPQLGTPRNAMSSNVPAQSQENNGQPSNFPPGANPSQIKRIRDIYMLGAQQAAAIRGSGYGQHICLTQAQVAEMKAIWQNAAEQQHLRIIQLQHSPGVTLGCDAGVGESGPAGQPGLHQHQTSPTPAAAAQQPAPTSSSLSDGGVAPTQPQSANAAIPQAISSLSLLQGINPRSLQALLDMFGVSNERLPTIDEQMMMRAKYDERLSAFMASRNAKTSTQQGHLQAPNSVQHGIPRYPNNIQATSARYPNTTQQGHSQTVNMPQKYSQGSCTGTTQGNASLTEGWQLKSQANSNPSFKGNSPKSSLPLHGTQSPNQPPPGPVRTSHPSMYDAQVQSHSNPYAAYPVAAQASVFSHQPPRHAQSGFNSPALPTPNQKSQIQIPAGMPSIDSHQLPTHSPTVASKSPPNTMPVTCQKRTRKIDEEFLEQPQAKRRSLETAQDAPSRVGETSKDLTSLALSQLDEASKKNASLAPCQVVGVIKELATGASLSMPAIYNTPAMPISTETTSSGSDASRASEASVAQNHNSGAGLVEESTQNSQELPFLAPSAMPSSFETFDPSLDFISYDNETAALIPSAEGAIAGQKRKAEEPASEAHAEKRQELPSGAPSDVPSVPSSSSTPAAQTTTTTNLPKRREVPKVPAYFPKDYGGSLPRPKPQSIPSLLPSPLYGMPASTAKNPQTETTAVRGPAMETQRERSPILHLPSRPLSPWSVALAQLLTEANKSMTDEYEERVKNVRANMLDAWFTAGSDDGLIAMFGTLAPTTKPQSSEDLEETAIQRVARECPYPHDTEAAVIWMRQQVDDRWFHGRVPFNELPDMVATSAENLPALTTPLENTDIFSYVKVVPSHPPGCDPTDPACPEPVAHTDWEEIAEFSKQLVDDNEEARIRSSKTSH